ncbi:MAG TPA: hypothetical protein VFJ58_05130 [Armatimonadota bacterium]|nr:hypothetical protein [Armatimonadota bacterium]
MHEVKDVLFVVRRDVLCGTTPEPGVRAIRLRAPDRRRRPDRQDELDRSVVDYGGDLHRLTSEVRTGTDPYDYSYTLDAAGNRSVWTDNTHNTSVSYTYDSANRLTAAGNYSYGYDADGNRTSVTVGGNTTNYHFDYEDRLNAIGTSVSYSYIGPGRTGTARP